MEKFRVYIETFDGDNYLKNTYTNGELADDVLFCIMKSIEKNCYILLSLEAKVIATSEIKEVRVVYFNEKENYIK